MFLLCLQQSPHHFAPLYPPAAPLGSAGVRCKLKQYIVLTCVQTHREWQMERAFQTALWLLRPEIVFILGDIFDEGKWSSQKVT